MVLKLILVIPPERMALLKSMEQSRALCCLQAFTNTLLFFKQKFLQLFKKQDINRWMSLKSSLPVFEFNGAALDKVEDSLS